MERRLGATVGGEEARQTLGAMCAQNFCTVSCPAPSLIALGEAIQKGECSDKHGLKCAKPGGGKERVPSTTPEGVFIEVCGVDKLMRNWGGVWLMPLSLPWRSPSAYELYSPVVLYHERGGLQDPLCCAGVQQLTWHVWVKDRLCMSVHRWSLGREALLTLKSSTFYPLYTAVWKVAQKRPLLHQRWQMLRGSKKLVTTSLYCNHCL